MYSVTKESDDNEINSHKLQSNGFVCMHKWWHGVSGNVIDYIYVHWTECGCYCWWWYEQRKNGVKLLLNGWHAKGNSIVGFRLFYKVFFSIKSIKIMQSWSIFSGFTFPHQIKSHILMRMERGKSQRTIFGATYPEKPSTNNTPMAFRTRKYFFLFKMKKNPHF